MRTFYFLGAMAAMATLGYVLVPRFIEKEFAPKAQADDSVSQPMPESKQEAALASADVTPVAKAPAPIPAPTPPAYTPQARPRAAAAPSQHHKAKGKKQAHGKKKKKSHHDGVVTGQAGDTRMDDGELLDQPISNEDLAAETGLTPAAKDLPPGRPLARAPAARGPENSLKDRWIPGLSGGQARLKMGKARDEGCAAEHSNCERPPAPKDLESAGVVVGADPMQPMTGDVRRGNYVNHTPAVYVK